MLSLGMAVSYLEYTTHDPAQESAKITFFIIIIIPTALTFGQYIRLFHLIGIYTPPIDE